MKLARAHAEEGIAWYLGRLLDELEALAVLPAFRSPQLQTRRVQELLPRVRTDRVPEHCLILAAPQAVPTAILFVAPTNWEIRS